VLDSDDDAAAHPTHPCEARIARRFGVVDRGRPADAWLADTVRWTWRVKASLHLELELMNALRERAEAEAIRVFGNNLHDLLLAAPAGKPRHHGPRSRSAHRRQGRRRRRHRQAPRHATIYPHEPRRDWDGALHQLALLARKHARST
jgi:uncharacterized protein